MRNFKNAYRMRILSLLLAALLLSACGTTATTDTTDSAETADTTVETQTQTETEAETEPADPYDGIDLGGMELRILNVEGRLLNTMSVLDYEELTGVGLDDAVYNRNRTLEDRLNMKLAVSTTDHGNIQEQLSKTVSAAEDAYDAVYDWAHLITKNVIAGNFLNLMDIDTIPLSEPWWEPNFNGKLILENSYLYQVSTPIHLMAMDMTVACYMNTEILRDHGVELPYDTVREGKWTYDAMYEAMTPCISLNGDEAFTPKAMDAIFGVATFSGWIGMMATIPDAMVKLDEKGTPYFAEPTDRMFTAYENMAKLFAGDGYMLGNSSDMNYDISFLNERAAFCIISIGNANVFRDMDSAYGILPIPKYLETDADSSPIGMTLLLGIPVTCQKTESVGIALDAMARYSYENVLPVYYESLCYKYLRDEDSVEMLERIQQSRTADLGVAYGWTSNFVMLDLGALIAENEGNYASTFAKNKESISASIEGSLAAMRETWE